MAQWFSGKKTFYEKICMHLWMRSRWANFIKLINTASFQTNSIKTPSSFIIRKKSRAFDISLISIVLRTLNCWSVLAKCALLFAFFLKLIENLFLLRRFTVVVSIKNQLWNASFVDNLWCNFIFYLKSQVETFVSICCN